MKILNPLLLILISLILIRPEAAYSDKSRDAEHEKNPIEIKSEKMRSENEGKKIIFSGNVLSTWADLEIKSDILEVYANPKGKTNEKKSLTDPQQARQDLDKIIAIGNVRIKKGARKATGDRAYYDNKKQKIILTGEPVNAWEGENIIKGGKVTFYLEKDLVEVNDRVHLLLFPKNSAAEKKGSEKKNPVDIQSDNLRSENEGKKFIFSGNVISANDDLEIKSDILEVYTNPESQVDRKKATTDAAQARQDLDKIIAVGNVRITKGDRKAIGDRAQYDNLKQIIVITGEPNVTAWEGENIIKGGKMTFHLERDLFEVNERVRLVLFPKNPPPEKKK